MHASNLQCETHRQYIHLPRGTIVSGQSVPPDPSFPFQSRGTCTNRIEDFVEEGNQATPLQPGEWLTALMPETNPHPTKTFYAVIPHGRGLIQNRAI